MGIGPDGTPTCGGYQGEKQHLVVHIDCRPTLMPLLQQAYARLVYHDDADFVYTIQREIDEWIEHLRATAPKGTHWNP